MKLSVVIPTYDRRLELRRLLDSIVAQDFSEQDFEIIVVDNFFSSETENLVDHVCRIPHHRYLHAGYRGANLARNTGIKAAAGKIIILLDDDCVLPRRDFLRAVDEAHRRHSNYAAIGGGYLLGDQPALAEKVYHIRAEVWLDQAREWNGSTRALVGGNVSYKRSVFESGLFFDEALIFGGTETEFHQRLLAKGLRLLFLERLSVTHTPRLRLRGLLSKAFL
jgi:glycosyltransferase involved in cell wall biosynthesis